jgi:hypothetical protein
VFDVVVDGEVVYSKQKLGAFLSTQDVVDLVRSRVEQGGA